MDQPRGHGSCQVVHIRRRRGVLIVERVTDTEHQALDKRIALSEQGQDLHTRRITPHYATCDFFDQGATKINVHCPKCAVHT